MCVCVFGCVCVCVCDHIISHILKEVSKCLCVAIHKLFEKDFQRMIDAATLEETQQSGTWETLRKSASSSLSEL